MNLPSDPFRPSEQSPIHRAIYDAWVEAANSREERQGFDDVDRAEAFVIWVEANRQAAMNPREKLSDISLKEVFVCQQMALGHTDYGLQWVCMVIDYMRRETMRRKESQT